MNYAEFVSKPKSMVVAPAGYGKTYAIAECLKHTKGKQLILTHTHAGVASLKEKILKQGVVYNQYRVETISSFAQKYVNAFYCGNDIPEQDDKVYFPFVIEKATKLFKIGPIKDVIHVTYSGLFVDEYQDCTIAQHDLVKALACILPTRVLGDHLQGIFGFKGQQLVDFEKDLMGFERFPDLCEPWRWKGTNLVLGEDLKKIREKLEKRENIDLNLYETNIEISSEDYDRKIWDLINEDSVLVITPNSSSMGDREKFITKFNYYFRLLEAVDHKTFYNLARELDKFKSIEKLPEKLMVFLKGEQVEKKKRKTRKNTLLTGLNKYFPDDEVLPKPREEKLKTIVNDIKKFDYNKSYSLLARIFREIKKLKGINCTRLELYYDLCEALEHAEHKSISVYEAMKEIRNIKRRMGRKVSGRCIGTTLLTKGLEFDTVAVLDAHKFKCPKNFYVAITRACRKLIIFTNNKILSPYP
ncbi:MAG: AAA family ATPase [Planctomycetes bacterium]|nr:AAA family ATPase [Planctomycetota bacterium]